MTLLSLIITIILWYKYESSDKKDPGTLKAARAFTVLTLVFMITLFIVMKSNKYAARNSNVLIAGELGNLGRRLLRKT